MVHLFKYVRGTKDLPLILSSDKIEILKWYIDGSYVIQPNMREQTEGRTDNGMSITNIGTEKAEDQH